MKPTNLFAILLAALVANSSAHAVTIDLVTIGNPGNAADTRYNGIAVGSVDHIYQIGKYEITAGQYTEFLNAVAKADPNSLYESRMGNSYGPNIQRTGSAPNYSYGVASDWANRPMDDVTFWDIARFSNWLHNGQPIGEQGPGTTEGGAYHDVGNPTLFGRNAGAHFFIPTEDEWYKAAYHKNDGITANYWNYPSAGNDPPNNFKTGPGTHANFYDLDCTGTCDYAIGYPYYRTIVGTYANSASPYGTFDQGGNVFEWTETATPDLSHVLRGGSFGDPVDDLNASFRINTNPDPASYVVFGFRVASIPEPASAALCLGALVVLMLRRALR